MSDIKVTRTIPCNTYKVTLEYKGGEGFSETYLRVSFQNWYLIKEDGTLEIVDNAKKSLELETAFNQYSWSIY